VMTTAAPIQLYVTRRVAQGNEIDVLLESVRSASGRSAEFAADLRDSVGRGQGVGGSLTALPLELIVVIPANALAAAVAGAVVAWARERAKHLSESIEVTIYGPGWP
jgi:hypothetical protein